MYEENSQNRPQSKKMSANRENAARSTGPKTPEGKKKVSRNAVKHGLLSKEVVIKKGDGKENEREYRQLLRRVCEDWQPVGVLEESQVAIIVECLWTLRRVQRCETAALRSRLDTAHLDYEMLLKKRFDHAALISVRFGKRDQLLQTSRGIRFLIQTLEAAMNELSETRYLTAETHRQLQLCCGKGDRNFAVMCEDFVGAHKEDDVTPDPWLDEPRIDALEEIDGEVSLLQEVLERVLEMEELELERRMANFGLPTGKEADRLLRYRTAIERRFYKAIEQLKALQTWRKGE